MNILIIGEFSGFAKHLKDGFVKLGHKVIVVQNGDGFKQIPTDGEDISYTLPKDATLFGCRLPHSRIIFSKKISTGIGNRIQSKGLMYDIIIVICSSFVTNSWTYTGVPLKVIDYYVNRGAKLILSSCGGDPAYLKYLRTQRFYNIAFPEGIAMPSGSMFKVFDNLVSKAYKIVVTAFDYYDSIQKYFENDLHIGMERVEYIPLPVAYEDDSITNCEGRKIVIFHGVTRPTRKGTPFFVEALERIKKDYPDRVDVIVDGNMPYEQYCVVMSRTDILLDQTNGYGAGVNCALGLMKGKVVFSGNEPEECAIRGYDSPVINASPDSESIYQSLKALVLSPGLVMDTKHASREYALKYQDSRIVAGQYLTL